MPCKAPIDFSEEDPESFVIELLDLGYLTRVGRDLNDEISVEECSHTSICFLDVLVVTGLKHAEGVCLNCLSNLSCLTFKDDDCRMRIVGILL